VALHRKMREEPPLPRAASAAGSRHALNNSSDAFTPGLRLTQRVSAHCGRMRRRQQISPAKEPNLRERCPLATPAATARQNKRSVPQRTTAAGSGEGPNNAPILTQIRVPTSGDFSVKPIVPPRVKTDEVIE
jgi:hypothetical protein